MMASRSERYGRCPCFQGEIVKDRIYIMSFFVEYPIFTQTHVDILFATCKSFEKQKMAFFTSDSNSPSSRVQIFNGVDMGMQSLIFRLDAGDIS